MKTLLRGILLALVFGLTVAARAQTTFTFTATAPGGMSARGYTMGESYTFVFTVAGNYPVNGDAIYNDETNLWIDSNFATSANLFPAVGGTGLTGAYVRPAEPYAFVDASTGGSGSLDIYAGSGNGVPLGLFTPLGAPVVGLEGFATSGIPDFLHAESYVSPDEYFADYTGTYNSVTGNVSLSIQSIGIFTFALTELTISVAAPTPVPEPATTAALIGAAGLVAALGLRRRRLAALAA